MKVILPFEIGDTVIVKEEVDGSIEFNEYIYDGISRRGHRFGYADESDECLYFDLCDVVKKYEWVWRIIDDLMKVKLEITMK